MYNVYASIYGIMVYTMNLHVAFINIQHTYIFLYTYTIVFVAKSK